MKQGKLNQVTREIENEVVNLGYFAISLQEPESRCNLNVEIQNLEHLPFHIQYLFLCVCVVSYVHKVSHNRWIYLLILTCNQHRSNTNKLKFLSIDLLFFKVPVDQINSQVETFGDKLKLEMNFDQPINQNRSHLFIDVFLFSHVGGRNRIIISRLTLCTPEPCENFRCILCTHLRVFEVVQISLFNTFLVMFFQLLFKCLKSFLFLIWHIQGL